VQLAVSDDHAGLKRAIREVLPEAHWQRCYVHFLRNALPAPQAGRRLPGGTALDLRPPRHRGGAAGSDQLAHPLAGSTSNSAPGWRRTSTRPSRSIACPGPTTSNLKSTNLLERLNQEIKRRTLLVRISPDEASCLRLVQALAVETLEGWVDENRYLYMDLLREHLKGPQLQTQAA
jgi:transposase-like protein